MPRNTRAKKVREALSINSLDAGEPSDECMRLLQLYIDGKNTIEENKENILTYYLNQKEDKPK